MKVLNDVKVDLGKEVDLYLPYQRLSVYDLDHNKVNSRELVYPNLINANVSISGDEMKIKFAGNTLTYPRDENIKEGEYLLRLKQDKLLPLFNKKMLKQGHMNPSMDNPNNKISVSAYDEDVLGSKLLAYVEVGGFEHYCSFVMENNFSVYKMSKFDLYVPSDGFVLTSKQ